MRNASSGENGGQPIGLSRIRGSAFVTAEMFIEAAHAVADQVSPEQLKLGMRFPPQLNILETKI